MKGILRVWEKARCDLQATCFPHNLPPTTSSGRTTPWFPQLRFVYMLFRMEGQAPPTFFELILGERKGPYGVTGSDIGKSAEESIDIKFMQDPHRNDGTGKEPLWGCGDVSRRLHETKLTAATWNRSLIMGFAMRRDTIRAQGQ
ncbi:hypothetical protein CIHG_07753 [Coccidioides immitis H538.4]|uniref:Uncharacterized protein n=3 Tax=Coccidioides immitis TaxID=5501 RepID=A0A0J8TSD6_COCIT|nr:hypothetical protein CIRG_05581 [Coccidioides immitis RMSCC 2394]KMU76667.1 hypothetical protein CISG_05810 [Coccidioides immitis RMSCC 3703]KMU89721.1 hypothetical protein CIHG_07753 [Coccidioides immitis H538.4]